MTANKARLLNLGCGQAFRPDWINVDFASWGGAVLPYDLRLGLPFPDNSMDVVYHSHVLEHFGKRRGLFFLRECLRVLKPGALLRVVVPDLENIARAYLATVENLRSAPSNLSSPENIARHQWMIMELVDQMTREQGGGEILPLWSRGHVPAEKFIIERAGGEYLSFRQGLDLSRQNRPEPSLGLPSFKNDFICGGELHRWMYDEFSLRSILLELGFTNVNVQAFNTSLSPALSACAMDADPGDSFRPRKTDSLFMEALKPGVAAVSSIGQASGASCSAVAEPAPASCRAQAPGVKEQRPDGPHPESIITVPVHINPVTANKIRVAMFSSTDRGGAGIAALRQHQSVREAGAQSHLYLASQSVLDPCIHAFPDPARPAAPEPGGSYSLPAFLETHNATPVKLDEIYPSRHAGAEFYSIFDGTTDISTLPLSEDFDLFHLHWVSNFVNLTELPRLLQGRPLFWTMHDMRVFTGGCHYAGSCRNFEKNCGSCPQLGSSRAHDESRLNWLLQKEVYARINLRMVSPSAWLAALARKSALLSGVPVLHIANPHPLDIFRPLDKTALRHRAGLTHGDLVLLFSSAFLGNTRKGLDYLLEYMGILAQSHLAPKIRVLIAGSDPNPAFFETGLCVIPVGNISAWPEMAEIYNLADAVIVPSLEDNFPSVICEAAACGVPAIAFESGGIPEMILHRQTGWLTTPKNAMGLAEGTVWLDTARYNPAITRACRAFALEHWNSRQQGQAYVELYKQALGN